MRKHLVACIPSLLLSACVSVQLPSGKAEPARGVSFQSPPNPFKEIEAPMIDRSWQSALTGNTISYFSTCGGALDPSLEALEREALAAINNLEVELKEDLQFNGRAARRALGTGQVDGVPVQLSVLVFKKNGCNYTLTYGGVEKNFKQELPLFEDFKRNFRAP